MANPASRTGRAWRGVILTLGALLACGAGWAGSDLGDVTVTAPDGAQVLGTSFDVTITVKNKSTVDCPGYTIAVYASLKNKIFLPGVDIKIGEATRPALPAGSTDSFTTTVTVDSQQFLFGASNPYFIGAIVTNSEDDPDPSNNTGVDDVAITITPPPSDLILKSVVAAVPSAGKYDPGDSFAVSVQVLNEGAENCPGYTIKVYASKGNFVIDPAADDELASVIRGPLTVGTTDIFDVTATLPAALLGNYYIAALVTYAGDPAPANNDNHDPNEVLVGSPRSDLKVQNVDAVDGKHTQGVPFDVTFEIFNNFGSDECPGYTGEIYVSPAPRPNLIQPGDVQIGSFTGGTLAAGTAQNFTTSVTLPPTHPEGPDFYIDITVTYADDPNTANNIGFDPISIEVTTPEADLKAVTLTVTPGTYKIGDSITLPSIEVTNNGGPEIAPGYQVTFYASADETIDTSDTEIGTAKRGSLAIDATDSFSATATLVATPTSGLYYIGMIVNYSGDKVTSNNTAHDAANITVAAPVMVLAATSISFTADQGAANPKAQTVKVTNTGGGTLKTLTTSVPPVWLKVTVGGSGNDQTLTLQPIDTASVGPVSADLVVTSAGATGSPQTLKVAYTVNATSTVKPVLALAPATLSFTAVKGTANPAAQTVNVTNSGADTLAKISVTGEPSWLQVTTGGAGNSQTITCQPLDTATVGDRTATLNVASSGAENTQTIPVGYTVSDPSNQAPQIDSAPFATPAPPVTGTSVTVGVAASDPDSAPQPLTFTWSMVSGPGTMAFAPNGDGASSSVTATFDKTGDYTLRVTVSDGAKSVTGDLSLTVVSTPASVSISPPSAAILEGKSQTFSGQVVDQFGGTITGAVTWSASGGGTIDAGTGAFTAQTFGGPFDITATSGAVSGTAVIFVLDPNDTTPPSLSVANPADGVTNVAADAPIRIEFSEAMDTASTEGAFSLTDGTTVVVGKFSWPTPAILVFTPDAPLSDNVTYTVTVGSGATDALANPLAAPITFTFTTAGAVATGGGGGGGCGVAVAVGRSGPGGGLGGGAPFMALLLLVLLRTARRRFRISTE